MTPSPQPPALTMAYADPPYPGQARRWYGCEEVNHGALSEATGRGEPLALATPLFTEGA